MHVLNLCTIFARYIYLSNIVKIDIYIYFYLFQVVLISKPQL